MKSSLSSIANGTKVIVQSITESQLRVKLMEMGLTKGKVIEVLYRAPLGDPMAIDINGYVLSLRKDEASLIQVDLFEQKTTEKV
ncbi:MAG: ferrous iron transport protein A [Crocinitomicaceae bacterium]|nr:ferrous iron transport protein A [Crocinitomicaceae bacterium]